MRRDLVQADGIAGPRPGDGAVHHAGPHRGDDLGEGDDHGDAAQRRHQFRLADRGGADAPPGQVEQPAEGLAAEHHLRRVGIGGEQDEAVALLQQRLEPRAPQRDGAAQRRHVRAQQRQVDGVQLGLVGRCQAEQDIAEGHDAEAQQLQHLLAADAAAVEGHDLRMHAPGGDLRHAPHPEGRLVPVILLHAGEAADDVEFYTRIGLARMRPENRKCQACTYGQSGSS